jgi:hypothetical protein
MGRIINWDNYLETILALHNEGKSPYYISKQIGVNRETLAKYMDTTLGIVIKRNGPRKFAEWVTNSEIRCSICNEIKDYSNFQRMRKGVKIYNSFLSSLQRQQGENSLFIHT